MGKKASLEVCIPGTTVVFQVVKVFEKFVDLGEMVCEEWNVWDLKIIGDLR